MREPSIVRPASSRQAAQQTSVILHIDDVGFCESSVAALADIWAADLEVSASLMPPTPWFCRAADLARANRRQDVGIHLTLTSEWRSVRWGAISTSFTASGLTDGQGFLWRTTDEVIAHAKPRAILREFRAQVQRAIQLGVKPTHLDAHMGAALQSVSLGAYLRVAREFALLPLVVRTTSSSARSLKLSSEVATEMNRQASRIQRLTGRCITHLEHIPLDCSTDLAKEFAHRLRSLPRGVTHVALHPARPSAELRAVASDWEAREAQYRLLISRQFKSLIRRARVNLTTYRALGRRDAVGLRGQ